MFGGQPHCILGYNECDELEVGTFAASNNKLWDNILYFSSDEPGAPLSALHCVS